MSERELTHGVNALRAGMIEKALITIYEHDLISEAKLLQDELQRLRRLAGLQYKANTNLFSHLEEKTRQPSLAAKAKAEKEAPYRKELSEWAASTYKKEKQRRTENDLLALPKKANGKQSASLWLLGLFNEDRGFEESSGLQAPAHECGNNHGSPAPQGIRFKATVNFFYNAIKKL